MQPKQDTRYGDPDYLNFSTLSRAISYDLYGTRTFNPLALYALPMEKSDLMQVGSIIDEHLTEWISFYDKYTAVSRRSWDDPTQLTNSMYETIDKIIQLIDILPYSNTQSFVEFIDESSCQETLECNDLKIKWKLDFYNPTTNKIVDLKITGNIDNFLKDIYIGKERRINTNHRYTRQLSWYSYLVEKNYGMYPEAELFAIDHSWVPLRISIPEDARRIAWANLEEDIKLLRTSTDFTYQVTPSTQPTPTEDTSYPF